MDLVKQNQRLIMLGLVTTIVFLWLPSMPESLHFFISSNFLGFHIILETISIITAFSIFIFGWKLFQYNRSSRLILLSLTFLMTGTIDFFHTISFQGMPFFITESSLSKATWLWVIARTLFAMMLLINFSLPDRKITLKSANQLLSGALLSTFVFIFIVFKFEASLPILVVEGEGPTLLKNTMEYIIIFIYLVLIYFSYRGYKNQSNFFSINIIISLAFMLFSELNFTMYLSIYDFYNFYGHVLKVAATYFILKAFYFTTIEQRNKNEQRVIETEQELSHVLKMQSGVIFKFQKTGGKFIFSLCEGELLDNWKYNSDEIKGKAVEEIDFPNKEEFLNHINRTWENKTKVNFEISFMNRHLFVSLKPIVENEEVISVIGSLTDLTELRKMEMAILNSEKLGTVGQLAAGVAHELRNPLTTLKGFLQLMKPDMKDQSKKYMELMLSEVDRLESITQEFMAVARPQTAHFKIECMNYIVEDVVHFLIPQAVLKSIEIHFNSNAENCLINCDANQLKQVWINLIKNSIEAMPEGGNIHVAIQQSSPTYLTIEIKDEGSGMPAEVLEKLGQPFFTSKEGGHGLGIMMTKKIIDAHQGTMRVESKLNEGTTFRITFPCVHPKQQSAG